MTGNEREQVRDVAELEVRRYFDAYLNNVLPKQIEQFIDSHNYCPEAHGGVEKKVNRMLWVMLGAGTVGGVGAGFGFKQLIALLGGVG
jgi:hypothetical protein